MRVVAISRHGPPGVLHVEERPVPEAGEGRVRIAVRAVGVNFADVLARQGLYPEAPKPPFVPGYEVAGVIDAVGEGVSGVKPGDRVVAMTRFGGYAEYVAVSADQVFPIPPALDFTQAAAIPVNFVTAYLCLHGTGWVESGDRVLIHAAAGGVGSAAVQLARLQEATLFGTAGSQEKLALLREWGVQHPINYREQDFIEEARRLTNGEGVDVILDPIGGPRLRHEWRLLRPGGRLVLYGIASVSGRGRLGAALTFLRLPLFHPLQALGQSKSLCGVNLARFSRRRQRVRQMMERLLGMASEGKIKPHVGRIYRLDQAAEAHSLLESRQSVGKLILTIDSATTEES